MYEDVFNDLPSSCTELFNLVVTRLGSLGYTVDTTSDKEVWTVHYAIKKTENEIKNFCNISEVPDGLVLAEVEMVCGNFLAEKLSTGDLASQMNIDEALKSVQLGDTNVSLADGDSAEGKLKTLIGILLNHNEDLLCYRKLKW